MLEPKRSTLKAPPCGCRVYRTATTAMGCRVYRTATTAAAMSQRRRDPCSEHDTPYDAS